MGRFPVFSPTKSSCKWDVSGWVGPLVVQDRRRAGRVYRKMGLNKVAQTRGSGGLEVGLGGGDVREVRERRAG